MSGAERTLVEPVEDGRVWGVIRKPFDLNDLLRATHACAASRKRGCAEAESGARS
jgi:hypothetical protein